jgi:hypothetical protein
MGRDFDYPQPLDGRMAKSYLWAIEKDARELRLALRDDDQLPGWVTAKIVTAQDRIQVVNRYMGHKIARSKPQRAKQNSGLGRVNPLLIVGTFLLLTGIAADKLTAKKLGRAVR